ncbi:hypothetical protein Pryu01_03124 [Paraliobacillus ryukyuensis]|uniref:DNA-binding XRE family transcriptional regulator n=1 Tax=Paraliobacillus ryukyuensis TaxID=200904 RepID=A0A366DM46_9BACI|nr:helix-turn-helix transcriptional regulator [Paraliobacillus ryukyuensis]RBO91131.1 DNA-binding XRE family transcriptional regulator [Paraliobacillus ryukyuensis]
MENNALANRLKLLRDKKGLLQKQVADKLGIKSNTLSGYENGSRSPDHKLLNSIADFYNVTTDYLLGRSDDPELTEKEEDEKLYKELDEILDNLPEDERNRLWSKIKAYAEGLADANKEN